MAKTIKINRYTGADTGWEQLYVQTPITVVTQSADSSTTFLDSSNKLRGTYYDFAQTYSAGEATKPVSGSLLKSAVSDLKASIEGKNNTWVISKSSDLKKTDGTTYSDTELNVADMLTITQFTPTTGAPIEPGSAKVGDNILIVAFGVPDWWVQQINTDTTTPTMTLARLETQKIDLTSYVTKTGSEALTNKTYNGYTLGNACAKTVATSVTSADTGLVTSAQVVSYVTGKQYITKAVNNLENYYTSSTIDSKISTINTAISGKLTEDAADKLYVKVNAAITAHTSGYAFPKWDTKGLVTGSVGTVYSRGLKIGNNTVTANALMRTTNEDIAIARASTSADGVMSSTTFRTLSNFFREPLSSTLPETAAIGDICFTVV